MFRYKTPYWIQMLFPKLVWRKPAADRTIYLTFDDGPVPEATPLVLRYLSKYQARATFFCVGENIDRNPEILRQAVNEGHSIGNHTQNHLDGWRTPTHRYLDNIAHCQRRIDDLTPSANRPLMRPPYGRLRWAQIKALLPDYDIIMWDLLSGDFSTKTSSAKCLQKSRKLTRDGSIVVFHDSPKTIDKVNFVLPRFLNYFSARGYAFESL